MANFDLTTAADIFNVLYPDGAEEVMYKDFPLYGMLHKDRKFTGAAKELFFDFAPGGGGSASFARAQANKSAGSYKRPSIVRSSDFAVCSFDGEALEASQGNDSAVLDIYKVGFRNGIYNTTRSAGFHLFRDGSGVRGKLLSSGAGVNTATVTLTSDSSMQGFEKGMVVQAGTVSNGVLTVTTGRATITAVNRSERKLTVSGSWDTHIPTIADGYVLCRDGDDAASTSNGVIKGLNAWLPDSPPTPGDSFFGIDRSSDPDRLAGIIYSPTGGSIAEILVNASSLALDNGGNPDLVVLNPVKYGKLLNEVGSKAVIDVKSADKANIGYRGIEVHGAAGSMTVICDPGCQTSKAWVLTKESWEIWSMGDFPRILDLDGNKMLRESDANAYELRMGGYLQLVCRHPGANVNVTLP